MEITRTADLTIGTTARFDLPDGDVYIGDVADVQGEFIVLRDYDVWPLDADQPYCSHPDDEVRIRVTHEARIYA